MLIFRNKLDPTFWFELLRPYTFLTNPFLGITTLALELKNRHNKSKNQDYKICLIFKKMYYLSLNMRYAYEKRKTCRDFILRLLNFFKSL